MANKTAILSLKIISDASQLDSGLSKASDKLTKFQQKVSKFTVPATAVLGGLALMGKGAIDAAAQLENSLGTVESTFGQSTKQVIAYADTATKRLNLSKREYFDYAAGIGSALEAAGVPLKDLANETDKQMTAIGEIAAAKGKTVAQVSDAALSAYRGEYDALQNVGIQINDSIIMDRLKAKGLGKLTGVALAQAKAQEVNNVVMENGAKFQGTMAKESGNNLTQQQNLAAAYENLNGQLGEILLPYMSRFMEILKDVMSWISQNTEFVKFLAVAFGLVAGGILLINGAMLLLSANPIVILVALVAVLIGLVIYVATQTTIFQDIWATMCKVAADLWNGFVGFFIGLWNGAVGFFNDSLANIGKFFSDTFNAASSIVGGVIQGIITGFNNVVGAVKNAIDWVQRLFNGFSIPGWMRQVMNFMGMGGTGFDMAIGYNLTGLAPDTGATGPFDFISGSNLNGSAPVINNNYTYEINMSGIIDQESAGREIQRVLDKHSRNSGRSSAAGGF